VNLASLQEKFSSEILVAHQEKGDLTVILRKDRCHDILKFLKEEPEYLFDLMADLCGVDYLPTGEKPRFEVVYHLYSLTHNHRLRVRVKVPEEDLKVPTVTDLWKAADWFEREAWEMFGFEFVGHPNLKHLLLYDGFEGHPLRKDYPIGKRQRIPTPEETL
jgi:NADH/F420H2 dehydrogenase subunit C